MGLGERERLDSTDARGVTREGVTLRASIESNLLSLSPRLTNSDWVRVWLSYTDHKTIKPSGFCYFQNGRFLSSDRSSFSNSAKFKILKKALADSKSHFCYTVVLVLVKLTFQFFTTKTEINSRYYLSNKLQDIETK